MDEIAEYQIDSKTYTQTFLTPDETIKVMKIIKKIKFKKFDLIDIYETLVKSGDLEKLFNIVLHGEKPIDLNKIKFSMQFKIIGDFFFFNDVLDIITTGSDLMQVINDSGVLSQLTEKMQMITNSIGTNSSPPPQTETSVSTGISEKE